MSRCSRLGVLAALALVLPALALVPPAAARPPESAAQAPAAAAVLPALVVTRQVTGLTIPWDVEPLGPGRYLITERTTARLLRYSFGRVFPVQFPSASVWREGETGLMSLAVDPLFDRNRRFYTCQGGFTGGGGHDVRVVAWTLSPDGNRAILARTLLGGFPTSTGRHGGCRLLITRDGSLVVGTGDAAIGSNPRNLTSLGGKVLRLVRWTGAPYPGNPYLSAANRNQRYVLTYGHRNIQGLAQRANGTVWSVEHGSFRDDEVNLVLPRGDYGWHPVPGYNERVPMTDQSLPGRQIEARWRSGNPTVATSGATWVRGAQWGDYHGTLAVAALKNSRLYFMKFSPTGALQWVRAPFATQQFGRLRSVTNAPDGSLLVTTSNGEGRDAVLRVAPR